MAIAGMPCGHPAKDVDALQEAIDRVVHGIRDPKAGAQGVRRDGPGARGDAAASSASGTLPLI